jgi:hypothetical protein
MTGVKSCVLCLTFLLLFVHVCNAAALLVMLLQSPALGSWYSLLLVTTYGVGDLLGKLLPIWRPRRPQATIMTVACIRLVAFFLVFVVALLLHAPPAVYFVAVFLLSLSGW